jgi:hypothetical protein
MRRHELEHILRAAGSIAGVRSFYVVGSQAILASAVSPPAALLQSMEADIWPPEDPEKADLIEGSIGEMSPFHETFGYYAHGVGPETAGLPSGWKSRVVELCNENTPAWQDCVFILPTLRFPNWPPAGRKTLRS